MPEATGKAKAARADVKQRLGLAPGTEQGPPAGERCVSGVRVLQPPVWSRLVEAPA